MPYYVIDKIDRFTSFSLKTEQQEMFKTEKAALKRARQLAKDNLDNEFYVVKDIATVFVPHGEVVVNRQAD